MHNVFDCIPDSPPRPEPKKPELLSAQEFALEIVSSPEFVTYIKNGVMCGDLPSAIVCRLMDYAWGKPPDRVEHTGKDGNPIVTEVRRVVVHVGETEEAQAETQDRTIH